VAAAVLQVFGDESGTMPVADLDDVFVAAAVAITDPSVLTALPLRRSNPEFTAKLSAYPPSTVATPHLFQKVAVPGICAT